MKVTRSSDSKSSIRTRPAVSFTLIELLVVVAIIAVLVAVLLPAMSVARQRAIIAACSANWHQVGVIMTAYQDGENGKMPEARPDWNPNSVYYWGSPSRYTAFGCFRSYTTPEWLEPRWPNGLPDNAMHRGIFSDPGGLPGVYFGDFLNIMYILPMTCPDGVPPWGPYVNVSTWPNPTRNYQDNPCATAVAVCDVFLAGGNPFTSQPYLPSGHHGQGVDVLRLDGHVLWRPYSEFEWVGPSTNEPWIGYKRAFND